MLNSKVVLPAGEFQCKGHGLQNCEVFSVPNPLLHLRGMQRGMDRGKSLFPAILALIAVFIAAPLSADQMRGGLLWNKTGLPAVFPLQVRTDPGADYYLLLTDTKTSHPALAAYIEGGKFFRVLVPPGEYALHFAYGEVWQGEDDLFGQDGRTRFYSLPKVLQFRTEGLARKNGHLIDLSRMLGGDTLEASLKSVTICQTMHLAYADRPHSDPSALYWPPFGTAANVAQLVEALPRAESGRTNRPMLEVWQRFC